MGLFSTLTSTLTDTDWLKRNATYGVAKESIVVLNNGASVVAKEGLVAGGAFAELGKAIGSSSGFLAGLGPSTLGVIGLVGVTTALSAGITQMEYQQERNHLSNLYREEIGSVLGKAPRVVKDHDLERIARGDARRGIPGNRVLGEELRKMKRGRTLAVALSVMASLASFAVVGYTAQVPAIAELGHGLAFLLTQGAIGVAAYNLFKQPLHWAAGKVLGLDKETAAERIASLAQQRKQGRAIAREQVFSVFTQANPDLDALIKSRYGHRFDRLDSNVRQDILDNVGRLMQIDTLTDAINTGRINAGELAFAVEGQSSGVVHEQVFKAEPKAGLLSKVTGLFSGMVGTLVGRHESVPVDDTPATDFAGRMGHRNADGLSHVERLKQQRDQQSTVRETP